MIKQSHSILKVLLKFYNMMMTLDSINTLSNNPKVIRIELQTIKIVIDLSEAQKILTGERNSRIVIPID